MSQYSWNALSTRYRGWKSPTLRIKIGNFLLSQKEWLLESLDCELGVDSEAGYCEMLLTRVYDAKSSCFLCEQELALGVTVEVSLGYTAIKPVFWGYLYEISYELGETEGVRLRCMDVKGAMMGNGPLHLSGSQTCREAIQGIFSGRWARGYAALCSSPVLSGLPELDQPLPFFPNAMDDYAFLSEIARRFGLEFFVQEGKLLIRKKPDSGVPLLDITPDRVFACRAVFSSVGYLNRITVHGSSDDSRDEQKKQVKGTALARVPLPVGSGSAQKLIGNREGELYLPSVRDGASAQNLAEAQMRERQTLASRIELRMRALPDLLPGCFLTLEKFSPLINGRVYISSVSHHWSHEEFSTTLLCRKEPS